MRDRDGKEPAAGVGLEPALGPAPSTSALTSGATPLAPPSPGLAPGAQRLPGEPTVSAWDPAALATMVGQLANQLFAAPSVAASDQHASLQSTPQQPASGGGLPSFAQAQPAPSALLAQPSPAMAPASGASPTTTTPHAPTGGEFARAPHPQPGGGLSPSFAPPPADGSPSTYTQPTSGSSSTHRPSTGGSSSTHRPSTGELSSTHRPSTGDGYPHTRDQQRGSDRPHTTTTYPERGGDRPQATSTYPERGGDRSQAKTPHAAPAGLATGATRHAPSAQRDPSDSPFGTTPNFDALVNGAAPAWADDDHVDAYRVPLVEHEPSAPAAETTTTTPSSSTTSPPSTTLTSSTTPLTTSYQLDSTPDLGLRATPGSGFDAYAIRREFPILEERPHGKRLVWLDNAATTHKPFSVIERISTFYKRENSNVHRAAHTLAARATDAYETARATVRRFLNAPTPRDIVFVRGATEGINLVAHSWGRRHVEAGDEIVITWLEHHANIVPWQLLCAEKGARLRVAPVDGRGQIILEEYEKLLNRKTRLVAIPQVSNALGTVTPTREMVAMAHRHGACVLVDGAQAVSHMRVDVQQLDCDFYVFSGHKVFAPTGIGVVYGRSQILDAMPPWQGGGNMIEDVTFEKTRYQPAPARFEAGTGNIADAVGLGAALDWLTRVGLENVSRHEHDLLVYGTEQLRTVPGLTIIGTAPDKAGVLSFVLAGRDTQEVATALDQDGIAVRGGHHCAQPILRRFGLESTVRASLAPYNIHEDIDALVAALRRMQADRPPRA